MAYFRHLLICLAVICIQQGSFAFAPPSLHRPIAASNLCSSSNDNLRPEKSTKGSFPDRITELDNAIAAAQAEQKKLLQTELDRYEKKGDTLGGDLVPVEEWTPRELKKPPRPMPKFNDFPAENTLNNFPTESTRKRTMTTRSKVSRSDAGTLVIEITPQGISSGMLFNGVFSVAWFSAIIPVTFAALSGGLLTGLFLLPFWMAGGMVAKQAVVDPFISNKLSIGQYAWSVESLYANNRVQKQEGSTDNLQGAQVEVPVVVNGVPQYQLVLYDTSKGVTNLGLGLPAEELYKVADEINEYLESLEEE